MNKEEIVEEVARQVNEAAAELKKELLVEILNLRGVVVKEVVKIMTDREESIKTEVKDAIRDENKQQIVLASNNQLAIMKKNTREIITAVASQIQENVYSKITDEINEHIVPKVNSAIELVHYMSQDGDEVVTGYRKAFEKQANPDLKLITDGTKDTRVISPHVRTFFENHEADSSEDD